VESEALLAFGRRMIAAQPFSASLGARVDVLTAGHAELVLDVTPSLLQQHGFVHGGVLAYLADNALTFAGGSLLGDSLTVEMKVNYLRPARDCTRLVAVADVVGPGKSQTVCRCDVFAHGEGAPKLVAAAQGTIRKVEPR
jgi:uncharacterized protein (TIGR00369 family)